MDDLKPRAEVARAFLCPYVSPEQMLAMQTASRGEEGEFFLMLFVKVAALIAAAPQNRVTDTDADFGKAYLHYFLGGGDWYILELNWDGGFDRAYGYVILNGDKQNAEFGYIDIADLVANGAELDLYFKPQTVAQALDNRYGLTGQGADHASDQSTKAGADEDCGIPIAAGSFQDLDR
jgi:hypothetical protein